LKTEEDTKKVQKNRAANGGDNSFKRKVSSIVILKKARYRPGT